jgi:hypothetical protein
MNAPPPPPAPRPAESNWTGGLREIMSAALSTIIVVVTMIMLWQTFGTASRSLQLSDGKPDAALVEAHQRQKDMLLIAIGLLGTVTGYYLGRVPAERAADAARDAQKAAERSETAVRHATDAVAGRFEDALGRISTENRSAGPEDELRTAVRDFRATLR